MDGGADESKSERYARLERALADIDAPFACVDLGAFRDNARDLAHRAGGKPIRLASKSLRCRALMRQLLDSNSGFRGVLAFTLAEALWLFENGFDDLVVGYPTADRHALGRLGALLRARGEVPIALMADSLEQVALIDAAVGAREVPVRLCLDVDVGTRVLGWHFGAKRSPLHDVEAAVALAKAITARPGFSLVGMMAYEAQIAGVGDRVPGRPARAAAVAALQWYSAAEVAGRRARIVEAVRRVASLSFVNGGGTGSVHLTAKEPAVTEVAAGSGLFGPALFDLFRAFTPKPAALFAVPVVRRPGPGVATALGGGYVASGAAGTDRLPVPYLPEGLELDPLEGAGEVQTPLVGKTANRLRIGDRAYLRHAKSGELCERFDHLYLVEGDSLVETVPTYRGEGQCFL